MCPVLWTELTFDKKESDNLMLLWASIFSVLKSSLRVTKLFATSLVCFPTKEKKGSVPFLGSCLLFKKLRGAALLAAVLTAVQFTSHFDVLRRRVDGDLRLFGITRLSQHNYIE